MPQSLSTQSKQRRVPKLRPHAHKQARARGALAGTHTSARRAHKQARVCVRALTQGRTNALGRAQARTIRQLGRMCVTQVPCGEGCEMEPPAHDNQDTPSRTRQILPTSSASPVRVHSSIAQSLMPRAVWYDGNPITTMVCVFIGTPL